MNKTPRRSLARRVLSAILRSLLTLLLVLGVLLVSLFSFEQATLRPLAEYAVERFTGRILRIEGELDAVAGRVIKLRIGNLSLANADWGSAEEMLAIGAVEVSVDLADLLTGRYLVEKLVVDEGRLLFEKNDVGLSNWAMGSTPEDADSKTEATGDSAEDSAPGRDGPLVVPVRHGQLSNIAIMVYDPGLTRPLDIRLDKLEQDIDADHSLSANLEARIDERPFSLQARVVLSDEPGADAGIEFDAEAVIEDARLAANGDIDNLFRPARVNLNLTLASPELSQTTQAFGIPGWLVGETEIGVRVTPVGDRHRLDISGNVGELEIDARARLVALGEFDGIDMDLSAAAPNLAAVVKLPGRQQVPARTFTLASKLSLSGNRLEIGDTRVDLGDIHLDASGVMSQFPNPEGTNLDLNFEGENYLELVNMFELSVPEGLKPGPFEVRADLDYSNLDRQTLSVEAKLVGLNASVNGNIAGYPSFVGTRLGYRLEGRDAVLLQQWFSRSTRIEGAVEVEGEIARTLAGLEIGSTRLRLGQSRAELSGTIGNEPLRRDTALALRFEGPDLAGIAALAGYNGFLPAGSAAIDVIVQGRDDGVQVEKLELGFDRSQAMASGFVSLQPGMPGSRVDLSVSTEEITDLVPPELRGYVQSGQAFALQTSLATDAENLAIDDLQANLGETSLTASGRMSKNRPMQDASLAIRAQGPDLSAVAPAEVIPYSLPEAPFNIAGGIGMSQHGLTLDRLTAEIGSETLQVSGSVPLADPREGLSLEVAAKGSDLGILIPGEMLPDGVGTYEAVAEIMLKGGILALTGLQVTAEPGAISGELSVSIDDPLEFGEFDLAANGVDLQSLLPANPQYTPPAEPFKLDAMGAWSGELVEVDRGVLELGESRIEAKGEVALRSGQVATGLVISARGDNLKDLGQVEGLVFPEHNFSLDLRLESDASRVHIPDLQAQLGDSELSGRFAYEFGDKPNIEIKLSSPFLDLAPMLEERVKQLEEANNEAAQTEPVPATASGKAIPDVPVPVETLNLANLVAEIDITELRTPRRVIQNLEIDVSLQDGDLQVSRFRAEGVEGDLRARFRTVVEGAGIVTSGEFEGREIVLGAGKATEKGAVFPKQNFRLEFDTAGATSRELVANLNGYAQLTGADGRLSNSYALGLFGSFFGELLSSVNPFVKREPYTSISCFAAYVEIVDGVATINPGAVLQTDKIDVFARGEVNLKSERIKMRFDTTARKGLGVSLGDFVNPFVGVGGTLARPRLGVDPENAMFEGGFAVATGGMSVVVTSLFRSWFGSKDPCADFAAKAEKYHAARLKKLEEQATEKQQQEIPDQEGQTGKIPAKENDRP